MTRIADTKVIIAIASLYALVNGMIAMRSCEGVPLPAMMVGASQAPPHLDVLPRADLTPGVADPAVTQSNIHETICAPGYSKLHRPPTSVTGRIKRASMAQYAISGTPADYELDHLVSLEIGGAPADARNLWPQPWEHRGHMLAGIGFGAESKDVVENELHRLVCDGTVTLADAQECIRADWMACGRRLGVRQ
jgi:hypothetical protein